jgi:hypothetical protein
MHQDTNRHEADISFIFRRAIRMAYRISPPGQVYHQEDARRGIEAAHTLVTGDNGQKHIDRPLEEK